MNMKHIVYNGLKCVLLGGSLVATCELRADTVAWWRFGDLGSVGGATTESMQLVNSVNAAKHPAIPRSFNGYTVGTSSAYMPRLVKLENATAALTVYDPVTGVSHPFSTALSCPWGGDGSKLSGGAVVTGAPELSGNAVGQSGDITFECFFRTSKESMERTSSMAAIFVKSSPNGMGAMSLLVYNKKLWTRFAIRDGKEKPTNYNLAGTTVVTPDVWHHAAFVYDRANHTVRIYLDYRLEGTTKVEDVTGDGKIYTVESSALYLGKSPCVNEDRSLAGEIAEARISDTALDASRFLRFREYAAGDRTASGDESVFMWHSFDSVAALHGGFMVDNPNLVTTDYTNHYMVVKQADRNPLEIVNDVISTNVRRSNPVVSDDPIPVQKNEASLAFVTNALNSGYLALNPLDNAIASDDFTLEFFYRTAHPVIKGDFKNSYALVCSSFTKILVDQSSGRLFCRFKCSDGQHDFTDYTGGRGDDGQWHHVAFTYSKEESMSRFYHNGTLLNSQEGELVVNGTTAFTIGYANDNSIPLTFDGRIDEFRLTRKTLSPNEFISTSPVTGRTHAWIRFENDTTAYPYGFSATAERYVTGGKEPAFVGSLAAGIDLSLDGNERIENTGACRFDGGSAFWPRITEIEKTNLTVEFFWRPFEVAAPWPLVLGLSNEEGTSVSLHTLANVPWALYYNSSWGSTYLVASFSTSHGGQNSVKSLRISPTYTLKDSSAPSCGYSPITAGCDGRWHHVAMTIAEFEEDSVRKTCVTTYWDYTKVQSETVVGTLNLKDTGHWLTAGRNGQPSRLARWDIDEIRITNGVLTPKEFLHKSRQGLVVIMK